MGLFLEKYNHFILGFLVITIMIFMGIDVEQFENFNEILTSAINISAIAAGFLATAMSLLITLTNEDIIRRLKQFMLYSLLIRYLKSALFWTFAVALVSSGGLFIKNGSIITDYFFYIWILLCVIGFLAVLRVIRILSKIMDKMSD